MWVVVVVVDATSSVKVSTHCSIFWVEVEQGMVGGAVGGSAEVVWQGTDGSTGRNVRREQWQKLAFCKRKLRVYYTSVTIRHHNPVSF
jgi:hypothetical protein